MTLVETHVVVDDGDNVAFVWDQCSFWEDELVVRLFAVVPVVSRARHGSFRELQYKRGSNISLLSERRPKESIVQPHTPSKGVSAVYRKIDALLRPGRFEMPPPKYNVLAARGRSVGAITRP